MTELNLPAQPFSTLTRYRLELVREAEVRYEPIQCREPQAVARFLFAEVVARMDREVMGAVFLDTRHNAIGYTIAYVGTLSRASVEPRGIFVPALLANAAAVIVFHNHPSGDPTPSAEDLAFTRRCSEVGEVLGVRLLDHLILGEPPRFLSLRQRGW